MVAEGMTRKQLSDISGVPERTLKEWWNAKRGYVPRVSMLEDVLQALGYQLKPTWLLDESGSHDKEK